jgi:uncharacterized membrane protein
MASIPMTAAATKVAPTGEQRLTVYLFSIGIMAMGALSVISGDFAYEWQPVPAFPGRAIVAIMCGLFMIGCSAALLVRSTTAVAARLMSAFLLVWLALKVPALVVAPQIEGVWLNFGEIGTVFAGGLVLFAQLTGLEGRAFFAPFAGRRGIRAAQIMFGLSVIPIGLAHLVYSSITAAMVPSWLPFRLGLAYLTGVAQMACGAAMLFGVLPRLAALVEAAMCALFAFLVWGPDTWFATVPKFPNMPDAHRFPLTAFLITWVVGSAALLVASTAPRRARPGKDSSAVDPFVGAAG